MMMKTLFLASGLLGKVYAAGVPWNTHFTKAGQSLFERVNEHAQILRNHAKDNVAADAAATAEAAAMEEVAAAMDKLANFVKDKTDESIRSMKWKFQVANEEWPHDTVPSCFNPGHRMHVALYGDTVEFFSFDSMSPVVFGSTPSRCSRVSAIMALAAGTRMSGIPNAISYLQHDLNSFVWSGHI